VRHAAHHDPANSAINMARYKLAGASINTAFEPRPRGLCGAAQKPRAVDATETHVPRHVSSIRRATSHAHFRAAVLSILELSIQPLLDTTSAASRRARWPLARRYAVMHFFMDLTVSGRVAFEYGIV
jgi:hypothetical protein